MVLLVTCDFCIMRPLSLGRAGQTLRLLRSNRIPTELLPVADHLRAREAYVDAAGSRNLHRDAPTSSTTAQPSKNPRGIRRMANIGIIGSGIAGLQLGLALQRYGVTATIYAERTPEQQLGRRLSNLVCRNAPTRARERQLRVNHWDSPSP